MRENMIKTLKYLMFIIIPSFSIFLCIAFKIAQGEKNEEIVFGIMLGILLDFIYSIILLIANKKSSER